MVFLAYDKASILLGELSKLYHFNQTCSEFGTVKVVFTEMEELRNRLAAQKWRLIYLSGEAKESIDAESEYKVKCSLREVWDKILELLNSFAEVATGEEFEEVLKEFNELESIYISAKNRLAAALLPDVAVQLDLNNFRVRLPTFKGGYLSWIKFRRIFRSCVVENNAFDDGEKLDMLKRLVTGHPLAIIQHEENFSRCWDLLHKTYHNRREIANALAKQILLLPIRYRDRMYEENIIGAFKEIYSGFIELCMFDLWDVLTTNMLTEYLDEDIVSLWRATLPDGFIPPLDNLLQFLDHYVLNNCSSGEKSDDAGANCVD